MPINNVYDSRFDPSTHELERKLDNLMPRSNPHLKRTLLENNQTGMMSINIARSILRDRNRTDIKVCIREDEVNCYSLYLNLVGLSENVAHSQTVVAVTIAAHEVGHALQPQFEKKLISLLGKTPILYLGRFSEYFILLCSFLVQIGTFVKSDRIPLWKSQIQNNYLQSHGTDLNRQYFNQPRFYDSHSERLRQRNYLGSSICSILKRGVILLKYLFSYTIFLIVLFSIFIIIPPSICCMFVCRAVILLTEIDASIRAMHLLKDRKILNERQLKAARKFLIFAGLSYLRFGAVKRLFD
ncbi:zinc metallopeptidase [Chamaesiphon minutus]|uniref:Putative Zn-dependent protease n=1 Tax=Chamaesiphon minutus (strain ATCC 27169 / PCC 6605) TaxID=1173020 RepID=K9UGL1_CHAP6|nr:zinc metallopeptidase [Chamaesiphon minutus]AFY93965.1 putative Zn-dependent protease [Chamaesiphon minutus PCC 6605]